MQYLRYMGVPSRVALYGRDEGRKYGLRRGQYLADLLDDTKTKDGKLSVYEVDDELMPEMVVAAIAAGSNNPGAKGYIIVDDFIFEDMNIDLKQTDGESKSNIANKRHFDAFLGSIEKRIKFAKKLIHDATPDLIPKPEMKSNIKKWEQSGFISE